MEIIVNKIFLRTILFLLKDKEIREGYLATFLLFIDIIHLIETGKTMLGIEHEKSIFRRDIIDVIFLFVEKGVVQKRVFVDDLSECRFYSATNKNINWDELMSVFSERQINIISKLKKNSGAFLNEIKFNSELHTNTEWNKIYCLNKSRYDKKLIWKLRDCGLLKNMGLVGNQTLKIGV